jgi:diguanylate cyclase (GGDEF)-like protein
MRKSAIGVIATVDDLVLDVLGFAREEMVGLRSTEFLHPDDHEQALSSWIRMLAEPGHPYVVHVRHRTATGHWLWVEATNTLDPADPETVHTELVLISPPLSNRTSVSNELLRRLAEALPLGIAQIDSDRRIVFSNGRLADICGPATGDDLADLFATVAPADRDVLAKAVESVLTGADNEIELSLTHPDRGVRHCGVLLSALAGPSGHGTTGALICVTDVTDETQQRADIMHRAEHDGLTGCLNRSAIKETLSRALAECADTGVAVIFIDLDHFKQINDTYGHAAGDQVLASVAERLRDNCRDAKVGRLGGDEFLVIAHGVPSAERAERLGARLAQAVRRPVAVADAVIRPAASVGVAWSADPAVDGPTLIARADSTMYERKRRRPAVRS